MVDTTISTPVEYEPPFRDAPLDAGRHAFSDAWVGWFTDVSDRLTLITQRLGIAEGDIAAGGGGVTDGSDAPAGHIGEFMSASVVQAGSRARRSRSSDADAHGGRLGCGRERDHHAISCHHDVRAGVAEHGGEYAW